MKAEKVLVTGSTGMLGKDLIAILASRSNHEVVGLSRRKLVRDDVQQVVVELTDLVELERVINSIKPTTIVHCAANTDVENCERDREYAWNIHVETTKLLASYRPESVRFIYISTDSVFDGQRGNYSENEPVSPINYYNITKCEGEIAAKKQNPKALILRSNIYGYHRPFKKSLVEWAMMNWQKGNVIRGYNDVFFNPLYTKQLASIINRLIDMKDVVDVLHAGCDQRISKFDFLVRLAEELGYSKDLVLGTSVDDVDYVATRPKNTNLNVSKLSDLLGSVPYLSDGLKELESDLMGVKFD